MNGDLPAVCLLDGGDRNEAEKLAALLGTEVTDSEPDSLSVLFDAEGVCLRADGMTLRGDFTQMLRRVTGGHLAHELLVHAAKTKAAHPTAIDATAGMGEDSLLLAAAGYEVFLFERDPVIAALLLDTLRRGALHPALAPITRRMHLTEGDGIEGMRAFPTRPELIYLDPMFPARVKSGLIGKKLQLLQKLQTPCGEEETLLSAALALRPEKLIIKRPLKGPPLAGKTPDYSLAGKAIRFDLFRFPTAPTL